MESTGSMNSGTELKIITSGLVITEHDCMHASIIVIDDIIREIVPEDVPVSDIVQRYKLDGKLRPLMLIDASNKYILPGLIDIHCDAIEKEVQPRPNTLFPLEMSFLEFERKLPLHGITTMYHSLSLGVGLSLRGYHLVNELIELIHLYNSKRSIVRNRIHLRFEVSYHDGLPIVERYVNEGLIHYLSYMDHFPGQGQYRKAGSFERYVMKNQGVTIDEVQDIVDDLVSRRAEIDWDYLSKLAREARRRGIAVASHDDDTYEKVDQALQCGINVSEFPITLEAATYAYDRGMELCVGAPNIVRGASHDQNLRATDAIIEAGASIICSDYYPASMLHAVFKLHREESIPLNESVKLATLNPARAMGIADEVGSIAVGKKADLIVVDQFEQLPYVYLTIVNGSIVYSSSPFFEA